MVIFGYSSNDALQMWDCNWADKRVISLWVRFQYFGCVLWLTGLAELALGFGSWALVRAQGSCRPQAIDRSIQALAQSESAQAKAKAALGDCSQSALPQLLTTIKQTQKVQIQVGVIDVLVEMGPVAIADLNQLLGDRTIALETRILAIKGLARIAQQADRPNAIKSSKP